MRRYLLVLLTGLSVLFAGCGRDGEQAAAGQVIQNFDANGYARRTVLHGVPQRVLILYPGAAEAMLELGLDEHILQTVGAYGSEPPELEARFAELPKVRAAFVPAQEEVFALQPDLIIGWAHNFSSQELGEAQTWQARGIGAYIVPATLPGRSLTLEDAVYPFLRNLGQMFGVEQRAEAYIASCRRQEERAMSQVADLPVATAVVLQDHGRSTYSLYDASYLIDDVLAKAGFANLVRRKTSMVGPERILAYDPDYLVYVSLPGKDGSDLSEEDALGLVNANPDLKRLRAVQQGHVIVIPFAEVNSGNGRAIDALNRLVTGRIRNR